MSEKINRSSCRIVRFLGILSVGYLFLQGLFTICCIQRVTEKVYFMENNAPRQILGIVLCAGLAVLLDTKRARGFLRRRGYLLAVSCVLLVTAFLSIWALNTRFWYFGDMEKAYQNAGMLLSENYSGWQPGGYLYAWPYQNGLIFLIAFLLKFFSMHESFLVFYGINILFYVMAIVSMALCLRMLYPKKETHCVQSLMLACYFPYGFFCMMLYGDVIGFGFGCLAALAMLRYLKNHRVVCLASSCVCMILSIIMKRNEMIVLAGLVILLFYDCFLAWEKKGKRALFAAAYLAVALLGIRLPDVAIGLASGHWPEGNSMWANVAMGLSENTDGGAPGWYNCYESDVFAENGYDTGKTAKAAKAALAARIREFADDPAYAWRFFSRKLASEWNNPTFECFHVQNWRTTGLELSSLVKSVINDGGKANILLIYALDVAQSVLLFGVLLYLIAADQADLRQLLFVILFLGGFIFFTFWEAKCRYTIPFFLGLIPYAFPGYQALTESIRSPGRRFCKIYGGILVIGALIFSIASSDAGWVRDGFKIDTDTEDYYQYIHEFNKNFESLRF